MSDHAPVNPFTANEWDQLHAADFAAGKAVVILMVGIFSMGVIIYSCVAYAVIF